MAKLNQEELLKAVESGAVSKVKHPTEELYIYNYTRAAVRDSDQPWESETLRKCRGIITDGELNIIARPFEKFFNLEEFAHLPDDLIPPGTLELPYTISEKYDGSLGIMYWTKDGPALATRSTFTSDQAKKGTEILRNKYQLVTKKLPHDKTFLFEIIYPENRIVVDYGDFEDLILIGVIDTETGKEEDLNDYPEFLQPCQYVGDWRTIREQYYDLSRCKEGFVVKFENGFRIKIKFPYYFQSHYLMGKMTKKNILRILSKGKEYADREIALWRLNLSEAEYNKELLAFFDKLVSEMYERFNWYVQTVKELTKFPEDFPTLKKWSEYVYRQGRFAKAIFAFNKLSHSEGEQKYKLNFDAAIWRLIMDEPEGEEEEDFI